MVSPSGDSAWERIRSNEVNKDRFQPSGGLRSGRLMEGQPLRSYFSVSLMELSMRFPFSRKYSQYFAELPVHSIEFASKITATAQKYLVIGWNRTRRPLCYPQRPAGSPIFYRSCMESSAFCSSFSPKGSHPSLPGK